MNIVCLFVYTVTSVRSSGSSLWRVICIIIVNVTDVYLGFTFQNKARVYRQSNVSILQAANDDDSETECTVTHKHAVKGGVTVEMAAAQLG